MVIVAGVDSAGKVVNFNIDTDDDSIANSKEAIVIINLNYEYDSANTKWVRQTPTVAYFCMSPAVFLDGIVTGDMDNPERINDDAVVDYVNATVNEYTEVDFGVKRYIRQYRFHQHVDCDGGSVLKIQYWDGSAWVDWVTGITGLNGSSWIAWAAGTLVATTKIRVVCTTNPSVTRFTEMSLKV